MRMNSGRRSKKIDNAVSVKCKMWRIEWEKEKEKMLVDEKQQSKTQCDIM